MKHIISQMENGNDVSQSDLQKIARKLVRFFKRNGFEEVSQDTRKNSNRYISIRIKGEVPAAIFLEASNIFPPTKTYVSKYYSYFWV